MKKTAYTIALWTLIVSFLVGTLLVIMLIWFEDVLGETTAKLFATSGVLFVASGIACIFLREAKGDDHFKKENLIN